LYNDIMETQPINKGCPFFGVFLKINFSPFFDI
jgi:hypothetical protein